MAYKLLICGGRSYTDAALIKEELEIVRNHLVDNPEDLIVIHGGAPGCDTLAGIIASELGIHVVEVKALWDHYGKAAGPKRNQAMLALDPFAVLAFPGGKGTRNMISLAKKAEIPLICEIRKKGQYINHGDNNDYQQRRLADASR